MDVLLSNVCSWCKRGYGTHVPVGPQGRVDATLPFPDPLKGDKAKLDAQGRLIFFKDPGYLCPECNEICGNLEDEAMAAYSAVYECAAQRQHSLHRVERDVVMRERHRRAVQEGS